MKTLTINFKKNIISLLCILTFSTMAFAQQNYKVEKDHSGHKMLVGRLNMPLLANDSAFSWFYTGVNNYEPHEEWVDYIKYYRDSFDVVVFAGTWDTRSQQLLPVFYRIMMSASYPLDRIKLFGVDEQLHTLKEKATKYKVKKLPTIIIFDKAGEDLGRVEEMPINSVEANLVAILQTRFRPDEN